MTSGSLINMIAGDHSTYPDPEVGMGATVLYWSDRHAATIIEVSKSGKRIVIQEDHAKRVDDKGMTDSGQDYEFSANPDAAKRVFTFRKNGSWVSEGQPMRGGTKVAVGRRDHYYDFSF